MMMKSILTTILTIGCAAGHMMVATPAPRDSKNNPNVQSANINYNLVAPVTQFGCSQFHETAPVVKYTAGQSYPITIEGGAPHNGGSCQIGISFGGEEYISLRDDVGNCLIDGLTYTITIPEGTPSGKAVIAWVWINKTGNREYYMNCIDVEIVGGPQSGSLTGRSITVANLPGYPTVPEGDSGIPITQSLYDAEKTITISQGNGGNNIKVETKNGGSGGNSGGQQYPIKSTSPATKASNSYQTGSAATTISNAYQTGSAAVTMSNTYQTASAATTAAYPVASSAAATKLSNAYQTGSAATTMPNTYPAVPSAAATTISNAYPAASTATTAAYPVASSAAATTVPNAYPIVPSAAATAVSNAYPASSAATTTAAVYPVAPATSAAYPVYPVSTYN